MTDLASIDAPLVPDDAAERRRMRAALYALVIVVWGGAMAGQISRVQPHLSANDRSRWCTVWSLVERGTYQIDEIDAVQGWSTIDKVRHQEHFYSSKPALLPTLVAGVYWCVKRCTGWNLLEETALVVRIVLVIVNLIPMMIGLALVAAMVERHARLNFTRLFVLLTAAWGTFLTTFTVTLNNHTPAAVAVLVTLYAVSRIISDDNPRGRDFALAGFFAMFACTNELPAALFGLAVFALVLRRNARKTFAWFVPAALVPLAGFFVTNGMATGTWWKPFYLHYGTETYRYVVDGIPSYWMNPKGIDAIAEPWGVYLLHCTVGHHGILSLSPVFLLTLLGWLAARPQDPSLRAFRWPGLVLTVAVLGFYLTRTENYNYGGVTSGLRWMFWLIPFWLLAMIPALDRFAGSRAFRGAAMLLLGVSVFSAAYPLGNPWQHPWLYVLMQRNGWIDYDRRGDPPPFEHELTSWFPSLGAATPDEHPAWIEFEVYHPDGSARRLRLADRGARRIGDEDVRQIEVTWDASQPDEERRVYFVAEQSFHAGDPPEKFLRWPDDAGPVSREEQARGVVFFQGLPSFRAYQPGDVRYVRTALRRNAFECRRAASRVRHQPPGGRAAWHRTDLWLSPEVPFGVVRRETTVIDDATGDLLGKFIYVPVGMSDESAQLHAPAAEGNGASEADAP